MGEVVATAKRIGKIVEEQTNSNLKHLVDIMHGQIRTLKRDLREVNEAIATHTATATAAAAMAIIPAPASTVADATQAPPTAPIRHVNHDYEDKMNRPRLPRCQMNHRPSCCFLCDKEGHVAANCPVRPSLLRLLRQQACASPRNLPQGPIRNPPTATDDSHPGPKVQLNLESSPEAKVTPIVRSVGPPITGRLNLEGIPVLGLVDTGASVTCMGFSLWWQYRTQWGPLKPFEGVVHGAHGKPLQIAGKTQHLNFNGVKLEVEHVLL